MLPNDLMSRSMQMARNLVGANELQLSREVALRVFRQHGGQFDQDGAPITAGCYMCRASSACEHQSLAFSILLSLSVFETAREALVDSVIDELRKRARE